MSICIEDPKMGADQKSSEIFWDGFGEIGIIEKGAVEMLQYIRTVSYIKGFFLQKNELDYYLSIAVPL